MESNFKKHLQEIDKKKNIYNNVSTFRGLKIQ